MNIPEELENLAVKLDLASNASEAKAKLHASHGEGSEAKREAARMESGRHFANVCREAAKKLRTRERKGQFVVPTLSEVHRYVRNCIEIFPGWPEEDARAAYDHYESVGWKINGKPMQDWRAAFRNCYRRWAEKNPAKSQNGNGQGEDPRGWKEWLTASRKPYKEYRYADAHWKSDFAQQARGEGI